MTSSPLAEKIRRLFERPDRKKTRKRPRYLRLLQLEDRRVLNGALAVTGIELTGGETLTISDGGMGNVGGADVQTVDLTLSAGSTWTVDNVPQLPDTMFDINDNVLTVDAALISDGGGALGGGIILNIQGDDAFTDAVTLDLSGFNFVPSGGIDYAAGEDAGGADNDSLTINGYSLTTADGTADVSVIHTGAEDGSVALSGIGTITFSEIEPLVLGGTAADLAINLPAGLDNTVVLSDDGGAADPDATQDAGSSAINGLFEFTQFTNPTNTLTVNDGTGIKTISVQGLDAAFSASVTLRDNDAADDNIVSFDTNTTSTGGGALVVEGNTVAFNAAVNTGGGSVDVDAVSSITSNAAGDISTTGGAGGQIQLSTSAAGNIALDGDLTTTGGIVNVTTNAGTIAVAAINTSSGGGTAGIMLVTGGNNNIFLSGNLTTDGAAVTFEDDVVLEANVIVSTGAASVTFDETVSGTNNLTVNNTQGTTFTGTVNIANLTTDAGGTTFINGGSVTTTGDQMYGDAVQLALNTIITANDATFSSTVNSMAGTNRTLTVNTMTAGVTTFSGNVGGVQPLGSLTTNNDGSVTAMSVTTLDGITFNDAGGVTLNGTYDSNNDNNAVGDFLAAGPAVLAGDTVVTTGMGAATFSGTVNDDAAAATRSLTVNSSGQTLFAMAVGTVPLRSLTTDSAGTTVINGGAVTTTTDQSYGDPLTLGANTILTAGSGGTTGGVTFGSTINGAATSLTVNSDGVTAFGGNVSGLTTLTTDAPGSTAINTATVTTSVSQTFNDPVTLGANVTINTPTAAFASTINADMAANNRTLQVNATTTTFSGAVGGNQALASLTTDNVGTTTAVDVTTRGPINFGDDVTINGTYNTNDNAASGTFTVGKSTTLAGSSTVTTGNGSATFTGTVNGTTAGMENLAITVGTGTLTFMAAVGDTTPPGNIMINSAANVSAVQTVTAASLTQVTGTGTTTLQQAVTATTATGISITTTNIDVRGNLTAAVGAADTILLSASNNVIIMPTVTLIDTRGAAAVSLASGDTITIAADNDLDGTGTVTLPPAAGFSIRTDAGTGKQFSPRPVAVGAAFFSVGAVPILPSLDSETFDQINFRSEFSIIFGIAGEENLRIDVDWRDPVDNSSPAEVPANPLDPFRLAGTTTVTSDRLQTIFVNGGAAAQTIGHVYTLLDLIPFTTAGVVTFAVDFSVGQHQSINVTGPFINQAPTAVTAVPDRLISSSDDPATGTGVPIPGIDVTDDVQSNLDLHFENGLLTLTVPSIFLPLFRDDPENPEPPPVPIAIVEVIPPNPIFVTAPEVEEAALTSYSSQSEDYFQLRLEGSNKPVQMRNKTYEHIDDDVGWKLLQPKRLKQWVDQEQLVNGESYELWLITTKIKDGRDVTFERPVLRFDVFENQPFPMAEDIPPEMPALKLEIFEYDENGNLVPQPAAPAPDAGGNMPPDSDEEPNDQQDAAVPQVDGTSVSGHGGSTPADGRQDPSQVIHDLSAGRAEATRPDAPHHSAVTGLAVAALLGKTRGRRGAAPSVSSVARVLRESENRGGGGPQNGIDNQAAAD